MGNTSGTPAASGVAAKSAAAVDMDLVRADIVDIMASPEWMAGPGLWDQTANASKLVRLAWQAAGADVVSKYAQGGRAGATTPPLSETSSRGSGRPRAGSDQSSAGRPRTWSGQSGSSGKDEYARLSRTTTADTLGTEGPKTKDAVRTPKIPKRDQYIRDLVPGDGDLLEDVRELLEPVMFKHPGLTYADLWSSAAHLVIEHQGPRAGRCFARPEEPEQLVGGATGAPQRVIMSI